MTALESMQREIWRVKKRTVRQCLRVLGLLVVIRTVDAVTGRNSLYRFGLVHTSAVIAFTVGVGSLLLMGPFQKWNDDISDRQRFSETVGFAFGLFMGLGCSVSAYLTNWPFDLATVLPTPQDGGLAGDGSQLCTGRIGGTPCPLMAWQLRLRRAGADGKVPRLILGGLPGRASNE